MLKMIFGAFIVLLCSNTQAQEINDLLYTELKLEFEKKGLNLEKERVKFETYLIENGYLKGATGQDKIDFLNSIVTTNNAEFLNIGDIEEVAFQFKLPMQPLGDVALKHRTNPSINFQKSAFASILSTVEEQDLEDRGSAAYTALILIDNISKEDYSHPFFNALFYIVLANLSDLNYRNNDVILVTELDYYQYYGTSNYPVPLIESRNLFVVYVDYLGELEVNQYPMSDSLISDSIIEWYLMNRDLSKSEVVENIKNRSSKGFNYPFYSHMSQDELDFQIRNAQSSYKAAIRAENTSQERIQRQKLIRWLDKKRVLTLIGEESLREIHVDAQIRIIGSIFTYEELFQKISDELQEGILKLRDDESLKLFNETYRELSERYNFFLNDFAKIRAIENQLHVKVFANPRNVLSQPPPADIIEVIED